MASINNCLEGLTDLTKQNLNILKTLNSALTSDKMHLSVKVDDQLLAIPSFLSLENKINNLQENFNNLVNAPKTGEAYFNFDGNSQAIELRGFTHMPNSIKLRAPEVFGYENNDIFKDFLTPIPYVNFSLDELPDDIVKVNVRKVVPKPGTSLYDFFKTQLESGSQLAWGDLVDTLVLYTEDVHYTCYDKTYDLPIRNNVGTGEYIINEILDDVIDENLEEHLTIKFLTSGEITDKYVFTYKDFNYADKQLKVGDYLVTYNDKAKLLIEEIYSNDRVMKLKVINGEYLNLVGTNDINYSGDYSKLKYFSSPVVNKTVKIPLEEDDLIYVAIAPLNSRMNIQGYWGTGVIINTSELKSISGDEKFIDYYKDNVKNIGDKLYELVMASGPESTKLTSELLKNLKDRKPELIKYVVTQINKHLNDTTTVKNIRSLYSQKKSLSNQLDEVINNISNTESLISKASFDGEYDSIAVYNSQLTEYNKTKTELNKSINKIVNEIASAANNAEIPIENAKYHIRGYCEISDDYKDVVKGVKYRYRYKNLDNAYSQAVAIDDNFLFSDWTEVVNYRDKELKDGKYVFKEDNSQVNEPSFNQIDIPISQGETVDIQVAYIYDYGYPYFEISSDWSDIENVSFPQEYLKDVQVLDIITENNSDIELNRFESIINETGITEHIGDILKDQDSTFYHKPENIASGYYTEERRVIPLKDKLTELTNLLTRLQDEVYGTNANSLQVSISIGDQNTVLKSFQNNLVYVEPYGNFEIPESKNGNGGDSTTSISSGIYTIESSGKVSVPININLTNNTSHTLKLFSLFPGSRDTILNDLLYISTKYSNDDYTMASSSSNILEAVRNEYADKYIEFTNSVKQYANSINKQFYDYDLANQADHEYLKSILDEAPKYKYNFSINIGQPSIVYKGRITPGTQLDTNNIYYANYLGNELEYDKYDDGKFKFREYKAIDCNEIKSGNYFKSYTLNYAKWIAGTDNDVMDNYAQYQLIGDEGQMLNLTNEDKEITLLYFIDSRHFSNITNRTLSTFAEIDDDLCFTTTEDNSMPFTPGMYFKDYTEKENYLTRSAYNARGSMNAYTFKNKNKCILYDDTGKWTRIFNPKYVISDYIYNGWGLCYEDKTQNNILVDIGGNLLYESRANTDNDFYKTDGININFLSTVVAITLTKSDNNNNFNIYNINNNTLDVKLCYIHEKDKAFYMEKTYTFLNCESLTNNDNNETKYKIDYSSEDNVTIDYSKTEVDEGLIEVVPQGDQDYISKLNSMFTLSKDMTQINKYMIQINKKDVSKLNFGIKQKGKQNSYSNIAFITFNNTWSDTSQSTQISLSSRDATIPSKSNNKVNSNTDIASSVPLDESTLLTSSIKDTSLDPNVIKYLITEVNNNAKFPVEFNNAKILYSPTGTVIDNDYYNENYNIEKLSIKDTKQGIWYKYSNIDKYTYSDSNATNPEIKTEYNDHLGLQTCNQFIYFRRINPYTGVSGYELPVDFYDTSTGEYSVGDSYIGAEIFGMDNKSAATAYFTELPSDEGVLGAALYPSTSDKYGLCISSDNDNYQLINPGQTITIPAVFEYRLGEGLNSITKTLSFDLRPSLYSDPINYEFTVVAKKESTQQDIVQQQSTKVKNKYNPTIIG